MKNRSLGVRGQTSLEYLMTYGWMLIIIGIVAVVLYQFGVFTPPPTPPGCTGFSQAEPLDCKASTQNNGNITLTLINNAGTKITLKSVNATIFNNPACQWTGTQDMRAGQVFQLSIAPCLSTGSPGEGEYYKADIVIAYRNVASGIDHNSVGECHGSLEH